MALPAFADTTVKVGVIGGEDEAVWKAVAEHATTKGLNLEVVVFNDYTQPNEALQNGEIDANASSTSPIWTPRLRPMPTRSPRLV